VGTRLLSKAEVVSRTGRSFPALWRWMREGNFPRARDCNGRPMWLEAEITDWMESLPVRRLKGDAGG
jgi:predicted DNA-binding transcriptional regulator AlpA